MLMLRQRNRYKIFMAGVAAAAILLSVFRIVVMINHIQINTVGIDFYLDRVPAVTAFDISAAAICIAAAVFSFKRGAQRPLARTASNSSSISLDGGAVSSETTTMHRLENRNAGSSS